MKNRWKKDVEEKSLMCGCHAQNANTPNWKKIWNQSIYTFKGENWIKKSLKKSINMSFYLKKKKLFISFIGWIKVRSHAKGLIQIRARDLNTYINRFSTFRTSNANQIDFWMLWCRLLKRDYRMTKRENSLHKRENDSFLNIEGRIIFFLVDLLSLFNLQIS